MMTGMTDSLSRKQKATIESLAQKGCSINEVGTALGYTANQLAQILEDEDHPFNVVYWNAKMAYTRRLRELAMNIVENSSDDAVRAKILEFLTKENSVAFENKRLHTGYTNIRKLLSLVRQQFVDEEGNRCGSPLAHRMKKFRQKKIKEAPPR
jgi:hypothetical protein